MEWEGNVGGSDEDDGEADGIGNGNGVIDWSVVGLVANRFAGWGVGTPADTAPQIILAPQNIRAPAYCPL